MEGSGSSYSVLRMKHHYTNYRYCTINPVIITVAPLTHIAVQNDWGILLGAKPPRAGQLRSHLMETEYERGEGIWVGNQAKLLPCAYMHE